MMEKYITDERTGIRYELVGDYYLPIDFGITPLFQKAVQERTQRHVYSQLVAEGKLGSYLAQLDEQANSMLDLLIHQMVEREGVTEALKADDQMAWVRAMNNIKNRAEEIVLSDLIYA